MQLLLSPAFGIAHFGGHINTVLCTDSCTLGYPISMTWTLNLVASIDASYPPNPTDKEASQYEHDSLSSYK
jgi:hypothetical protein